MPTRVSSPQFIGGFTRTNRCVQCWTDFEANYKSNVCLACEIPKEIGFPHMVETVSLYTMKNVSKTRLSELDRRTMLPDSVNGKEYVCGTKVRGKISDKTVDLTP